MDGGNLTLNRSTLAHNLAGGGIGGNGGGGGIGGAGGEGGVGGTSSYAFYNHGGDGGGLSAHATSVSNFAPGIGGTGGTGGNGGNGGFGGNGGNGGNGGFGGNAAGGGLFVIGGSLTFYNSTIADNSTSVGYGGSGGFPGGPGLASTALAPGGPGGYGGYSDFGSQAPNGRYGHDGSLGGNGHAGSSGEGGGPGTISRGGGLYIGGGSLTLYNVTVALNQSGVYQVGGVVKGYNSLFGDNGYTGSSGPSGADYSNTSRGTGSAVLYNSLLGSFPVGVINGGGSIVGNPGFSSSGLQSNGGPTQTIAIVAGSAAIGAGMNPINGVILLTDQRGYVPTSSAWDAGAYQSSGVPAPAPTATLVAQNVSVSNYGQTTYTFTVTYDGAAGITPGSLAGAVVTVDPPGGGAPITAKVVNTVANGPTDPWGDAQSFTVTYQITPPGGSWVTADNGTYSVVLGGLPVSDSEGDTVPAGPLGTFQVETGRITITKYGLTRNVKTGTWSGTIKLTNTGDATFSGPIFILSTCPQA
jgi:hypothetical protein